MSHGRVVALHRVDDVVLATSGCGAEMHRSVGDRLSDGHPTLRLLKSSAKAAAGWRAGRLIDLDEMAGGDQVELGAWDRGSEAMGAVDGDPGFLAAQITKPGRSRLG